MFCHLVDDILVGLVYYGGPFRICVFVRSCYGLAMGKNAAIV